VKDKVKTGGEALRGLIKTGGNVVDKALDKGSDVVTLMINNMTRLISKLSDDIGIMADRILTMEQRIGLMADRIVRTEELMARLTATMADKDLDLSAGKSRGRGGAQPPVLAIPATGIPEGALPELRITGEPKVYLLLASADPLFGEGTTVVSRIRDREDFVAAWRRSVRAIKAMVGKGGERTGEPTVVSVAVKTVSDTDEVSPISNSVDVTVHIA
jgi:hypothetical protein